VPRNLLVFIKTGRNSHQSRVGSGLFSVIFHQACRQFFGIGDHRPRYFAFAKQNGGRRRARATLLPLKELLRAEAAFVTISLVAAWQRIRRNYRKKPD